MLCRNPRCEGEASVRGKWCEPCAETLERVRAALEWEQQNRKQMTVSRRCRADGCPEHRGRHSVFCAEHQELEVE